MWPNGRAPVLYSPAVARFPLPAPRALATMDNSGQKRGTLDADPPSADAPDDLYSDLVERANDIFVIVGGDGVVQFVNQTYSRLTGIARREIEGDKLAALFAPDERQNAQSRLPGPCSPADSRRSAFPFERAAARRSRFRSGRRPSDRPRARSRG